MEGHTFNPDVVACLDQLRRVCYDDPVRRALIRWIGHGLCIQRQIADDNGLNR